MTAIGYYWDEKMVFEVTSLLSEYEDLCPDSFTQLKGIQDDLGEMNLVLKLDAKPMKHHPIGLTLE